MRWNDIQDIFKQKKKAKCKTMLHCLKEYLYTFAYILLVSRKMEKLETVLGSEEALGRRGLALHVSFGYFATYMNYLIGKVAIYINFIYI